MNINTVKLIQKFRDDRNWKQFHNPKDLAISLNLEVTELLEAYQKNDKQNILEELADILVYLNHLVDSYGFDQEKIYVTTRVSYKPLDLLVYATKLLELYQWSATDLVVMEKLDSFENYLIKLYDILANLVLDEEADLDEIISNKMIKNNKKYPADLAINSSKKYSEL